METVEAALLVEPKGTYGVGMAGHAVATRSTFALPDGTSFIVNAQLRQSIDAFEF